VRSPSARLLIGSFLTSLFVLAGCGADPVELPDVVGMPLDEAHRAFEALGFEEFKDADEFEDRSVILDSNWVAISYSPGAGASADVDETITFQVGKRDEQRAIDQLPADSPVAREFAAQQAARRAEEEADRAKDAAEQAAADQEQQDLVTTYVNDLDPLVRLGNRVFAEVDAMSAGIANDVYGLDQTDVVLSAVDSTSTLVDELSANEPPTGSKRAGTHEALVSAAQRLMDAARTLLSAEGADRSSSLARYAEVRAEAGASWNESLSALYAGTGVEPPLQP
jgi:hypothetical protein